MIHRAQPRSQAEDIEFDGTVHHVVGHWAHLDMADREAALVNARSLADRWRWEGLDGLHVTRTMQAHVAGLAAVLTLRVGRRALSDVTSILLPRTSGSQRTRHRDGALVMESDACVLGQAMLHGPVRLAWDQVEQDAATWQSSVVIHELAHKIDMADGDSYGSPPYSSPERAARFEAVADLTLQVLRSHGSNVLRPYAATNRTELFAVATEAFFLTPAALVEAHREMFDALADFYGQTPRCEPATT